jgi:hypothetical protein
VPCAAVQPACFCFHLLLLLAELTRSCASSRRQEGIYTTAKAVHDRLEQLTGSRGGSEPDSGEAAAEVTSLFTWQASGLCSSSCRDHCKVGYASNLTPPCCASVSDYCRRSASKRRRPPGETCRQQQT